MSEKLIIKTLDLQIEFYKKELKKPSRKTSPIGDLDLALRDDLNDTIDHYNIILPENIGWNDFTRLEKYKEARNLLSQLSSDA